MSQEPQPGAPAGWARCGLFTAGLGCLLALLPCIARADLLIRLDGRSIAGSITFEQGTFVVRAANGEVQRVPLADVRAAKFDRPIASSQRPEWEPRSVGPLPAAGSLTLTNGQFVVHGSGTAAAVEDGHYFVQQTVGETARSTAFLPPPAGTRGSAERYKVAGLAVLGRFDASGPVYYLLSEGTKAGITRWRTAAGKERSKHFTIGPAGVWLRLELCGRHVAALASDDGLAWRAVGGELIDFPEAAHVGLLVAGARKGVPATVAFTHFELLHMDAPPGALPQLHLRDGGVLAGRFVSADGSVVRWQALGREWQVSQVNISRLLFDPRGAATAGRLTPGRPGALLASGDFVDGELVGGAEGRVTISSVLFGLKSYTAEGALLAVQMRDAAKAPAQFELLVADGSRLLTNQLELRADGLAGRECSAGEFLLRPADVVELLRSK